MNKEQLKFLESALCKDKTRYNLTTIHRDRTQIVATCGHRMHWIDNQSIIDNVSTDYPDWKRVLPEKVAEARFKLLINKSLLSRLKLLRDIAKLDSKACNIVIEIACDNQILSLSHKSIGLHCGINVDIEHDRNSGKAYRIGLNASYLYDALANSGEGFATIEIHGELSPLVLHLPLENAHALIMPMRIE